MLHILNTVLLETMYFAENINIIQSYSYEY